MNAYWKRGLRVSGRFSELGQSLTSAVTAGNIAETGANALQFLDLVMGRWSFHSLFSIF